MRSCSGISRRVEGHSPAAGASLAVQGLASRDIARTLIILGPGGIHGTLQEQGVIHVVVNRLEAPTPVRAFVTLKPGDFHRHPAPDLPKEAIPGETFRSSACGAALPDLKPRGDELSNALPSVAAVFEYGSLRIRLLSDRVPSLRSRILPCPPDCPRRSGTPSEPSPLRTRSLPESTMPPPSLRRFSGWGRKRLATGWPSTRFPRTRHSAFPSAC